MAARVTITVLENNGDVRGESFSAGSGWPAFLGTAQDLHLTSLQPGHSRGNHFHQLRREVIVVIHRDEWTLHWDSGPDTDIQSCLFEGTGAVLLTVEPLAAHAVANSGKSPLYTIGLTDSPYDKQNPDTFPRDIITMAGGI